MKKIITLIAVFVSLAAFAQQNVSKKVIDLVAQQTSFRKISALTVSNSIENNDTRKAVTKATYAKLKQSAIDELMAGKFQNIEVEVPFEEKIISVLLYKVDLFAQGFHVDTDKKSNNLYNKGLYYRGIVKGNSNSIVSFNFFNNEINGIISAEGIGNIVVGKLDKLKNTTDYIIYADADLKANPNLNCATKDVVTTIPNTSKSSEVLSTKCVTMYFEIDYALYQANDSSIETTTNWMTSVFNNVQTLYLNDGITVALRSMYIWTENDPYSGTSSSDYLYEFNEQRPVFDGDVGQLIGIDPGGLGGVAVTIDGICNQNNFSYSDVDFNYNTVPTYSWTVMVITHEFGHLLGSPHTHACVWNGNNTAIDNCAPQALGEDWEGGNCMTSPPTIPSTTEKGSLMSYCHLISGVGISFNNGFGPQPAALILNTINSGACLGTDCITTCINTVVSIETQDISPTSSVITWTDAGSSEGFQISVRPYSSSSAVWNTVSSNTYTATNLLPNTYYRVRVRPNCGSDFTAPNEEFVFLTSADYCSQITLTDTGGVNGNYGDSQNYVRTLIPSLPNTKMKLTFTAFDLEPDYDYIYVYDGNNTSAPDLSNNGFSGTSIPEPFTSTAVDGSLTLKFFSDTGVTESGYVANTQCISTLGNQEFAPTIDFTYYPNPTNSSVNITSKTQMDEVSVYNPQGRLLYRQKIDALDTKVDLGSFATGTYFFKLKFNDKEANFKIVKFN